MKSKASPAGLPCSARGGGGGGSATLGNAASPSQSTAVCRSRAPGKYTLNSVLK